MCLRSKIQGLGLYAARDMERHTMIIEYIGEVIRSEVSEIREKQYEARVSGILLKIVSIKMSNCKQLFLECLHFIIKLISQIFFFNEKARVLYLALSKFIKIV